MKRIVVLGAGESGAGAAVLARQKGFDVFVSDMSAIHEKYKKILDDTTQKRKFSRPTKLSKAREYPKRLR